MTNPKDCHPAKPTDGGWEDDFKKEFAGSFIYDNPFTVWSINNFIRQAISAAVLAERQRCVEAVGSIPMPQWDVPEIDGTMPDDPKTAADQMRISTVKAAIEAINGK